MTTLSSPDDVTATKTAILTQLTAAIIEGRLAPGYKINETELEQMFGVSRTVIREVMWRLERDGMVHLPLNRGAYVAAPSRDEARARVRIATLLVADVAGVIAQAPKTTRERFIRACAAIIASLRLGDTGPATAAFVDLVGKMAQEAAGDTMAEQASIAVAIAHLAMRANACEVPLLTLVEDLQQAWSVDSHAAPASCVRAYYGIVEARLRAKRSGNVDLRAMLRLSPAEPA